MSQSWWEYVERISAYASQKDIAATTGLEQSSVSRWKLSGATPRWEAVVATARAYNRPPIEAFIAAGYITPEEAAEVVRLVASPAELSTQDLLAELGRRALRRGNGEDDQRDE